MTHLKGLVLKVLTRAGSPPGLNWLQGALKVIPLLACPPPPPIQGASLSSSLLPLHSPAFPWGRAAVGFNEPPRQHSASSNDHFLTGLFLHLD